MVVTLYVLTWALLIGGSSSNKRLVGLMDRPEGLGVIPTWLREKNGQLFLFITNMIYLLSVISLFILAFNLVEWYWIIIGYLGGSIASIFVEKLLGSRGLLVFAGPATVAGNLFLWGQHLAGSGG